MKHTKVKDLMVPIENLLKVLAIRIQQVTTLMPVAACHQHLQKREEKFVNTKNDFYPSASY